MKLRRSSHGNLEAKLDLQRNEAHHSDMNQNKPIPFRPNQSEKVAFQRRELGDIMTVYGRMVAAGEWRDYGIAMLNDVAIFSIYKRAAEHPIYRIEKRPKLATKQQTYAVIGMDGRILKRGADLRQVLRVLEKKMIRSVD